MIRLNLLAVERKGAKKARATVISPAQRVAIGAGLIILATIFVIGWWFWSLRAEGAALDTDMHVRGTVSRVRFDNSAPAFLDEVLSNGWEHHLVMAYGEILPDLQFLARALGVPLTVK